MKKSLFYFVICAGLLLGACGVPPDPTGATDQEGALRCTDCPEPPLPPPPSPTKPTPRPTIILPTGRAFRAGHPVEIKNLTNADIVVQYQGWETRAYTAWATVGPYEIGVYPTVDFHFDVKAIDSSTCHVELYVDHFNFWNGPEIGPSHILNYNVNQDAYCYTVPFSDESENNNSGIKLEIPSLDMHIWAKREDRLRIRLGDDSSYLWQMEIDSDENR